MVEPVRGSFSSLGRGEIEEAMNHGENFVRRLAARYAWFVSIKWMVATIIGVLAVFAGLAGSALIFKQNDLIQRQNALLMRQDNKLEAQNLLFEQQNIRIDVQNQLAEAARRATLVFELTSINEKIDELRGNEPDTPVTLPQNLIARIVALSRSLRAYQFIELPSTPTISNMAAAVDDSISARPVLVRKPLSPERGQLLLTIVNANIANLADLISAGVDFRSADLRGVFLDEVALDLAILSYTNFSEVYLLTSSFRGAELEGADFSIASMKGTDFSSSDQPLIVGRFGRGSSSTNLRSARFFNSQLNNSDFSQADLRNADFRGALLFGVDFSGADMTDVELDGAYVSDENWLEQLLLLSNPPKSLQQGKWKIVKERPQNHPFLPDSTTEYWTIRSRSPISGDQ